ncbi:hypothetical protein SLA2020_342980 [Shorea laevis]
MKNSLSQRNSTVASTIGMSQSYLLDNTSILFSCRRGGYDLQRREAPKVYRQSTMRALLKKMKNQSEAFELHLTKQLSKIMWMGKIALFLAITFIEDLNLQLEEELDG